MKRANLQFVFDLTGTRFLVGFRQIRDVFLLKIKSPSILIQQNTSRVCFIEALKYILINSFTTVSAAIRYIYSSKHN